MHAYADCVCIQNKLCERVHLYSPRLHLDAAYHGVSGEDAPQRLAGLRAALA